MSQLLSAVSVKAEIGIVALPFVPVPPNFEAVLGYAEDRRYVAFYWAAEDGTLCCTDGAYAVCGSGLMNPSGWHLFVTHPSVIGALDGLDVYSEHSAHALILDREERRMYGATIQDARDVLAGRRFESQQPSAFPAGLQNSFFAIARSPLLPLPDGLPSAAEVEARVETRRSMERAMLEWLNNPDPQEGRKHQVK